MLVSGLQIERKKISQQKRQLKSKNKKPSRPYSSQLPQINQLMKRSTQNIEIKYQTKKLQINPSKKPQLTHQKKHQLTYQKKHQLTYQKKHQLNIKELHQHNTKERHYSTNKYSIAAKPSKKNLSNKQLTYEKQPQTNTIKSSLKQIRQFNTTNNNKKPQFQEDQKRSTKKKLQIPFRSPSGHVQITRNTSLNLSLFDQIEKQKVTKYFRYYPIVIIQACLKRDPFMISLTQIGDVQVYNKAKATNNKKKTIIDMSQPWAKLLKLANLKGKYKYREKFNFSNSAQLKAIKWKRKQVKKKKESESSSSEEQQKKQKCRDMDTWKKSMGVEGAKVFIIKGKYTDFKNALLERGWVQNPDKTSSFFDMKWTTKVSDLSFESLKHNQIVNHFNNNACLTSKYGICKSLRSVMYSDEIDVDRFFPKAFDLTDCSDFQNFLQVYKWQFCESILKAFIIETNTLNKNINVQSRIKPQIIKLAYIIISRRLSRLDTIIKHTLLEKYFLPSIEQWMTIFNDDQKDTTITYDEFYQTFQAWNVQTDDENTLKSKVQNLLEKLQEYEPQYDINGYKNIWIVKPAFLSRGRGIKCLNKFNDILNYSLGKQTQYVVQKYIENPLIINKKKFDIRQWVLVEDYNPPKIWIYGEFYCRFCLEDYDESKITNKFAHLTNNSVQKYKKNMSQAELKQSLKNSMWTQQQLKGFIDQKYIEGSFKIVQQKMREIVISTILSTADQIHGRRNSFQLIGYDFMIDDLLNPWLIEINTSPAMDYSTPVTQRLVKMVLEDVVKVVVDLKTKKSKKKTAGLFKCIYNGEDKFVSKHYNLLKKYPQQKKQKINQTEKQNDLKEFQQKQINRNQEE